MRIRVNREACGGRELREQIAPGVYEPDEERQTAEQAGVRTVVDTSREEVPGAHPELNAEAGVPWWWRGRGGVAVRDGPSSETGRVCGRGFG